MKHPSAQPQESLNRRTRRRRPNHHHHHPEPWQLEWKRPQWQRPLDFINHVDGRPMDHVAAAVRYSEIPTTMITAISTKQQVPSETTALEPDDSCRQEVLLLTVTLIRTQRRPPSTLSKDASSSTGVDERTTGDVADAVLVELLQQTSNGSSGSSSQKTKDENTESSSDNDVEMECLQSRLLQWPSYVLQYHEDDHKLHEDDNDEEEQGEEQDETQETPIHQSPPPQLPFLMLPWWNRQPRMTDSVGTRSSTYGSKSTRWHRQKHKQPRQRNGLVAAAFCRKPTLEDAVGKVQDTLDMLDLLSLGLKPASSSSKKTQQPTKNETKSTENVVNEQPEPIGDLLLACVSNSGQVYFYSPWSLLEEVDVATGQKHGRGTAERLDDGFASLLLGQSMLSSLKSNILPLSQPLHTLSLSVPIHKVSMQTSIQNSLTMLFPKRDKVSVNSQAPSIVTQTPTIQEGGSDDGDIALSEVDEADDTLNPISVWDSAVWDATIDPATIVFQTKSNRPTLCTAALDYLCVAGKGHVKRRRKGKRHLHDHLRRDHQAFEETNTTISSITGRGRGSHAQLSATTITSAGSAIGATDAEQDDFYDGGFVTFFSLRNFSEVRTLYLPFAPRDISPFVWGCMTFLLVLGTHHSSDQAIVIRIDPIDVPTVTSGEIPSLYTQESQQQQRSHMETSEHGPEQNKKAPKPEIPVRRFQVIPIHLPDTEDLTPLIVGSSYGTVPPGLAFVFVDEHGGEVSIIQRVFRSLSLIATDEVHADYLQRLRPDTSEVAAIVTEHSLAHTARISLPPAPSVTDPLDHRALAGRNKNLWCHLGQGWCIVGVSGHRYFVCWDGSTSTRGSFVYEFDHDMDGLTTGLAASVLPIRTRGEFVPDAGTPGWQIPFSGDPRHSSTTRALFVKDSSAGSLLSKEATSSPDDIIDQALRSISSQRYRETVLRSSPPQSPRRNTTSYSHREKSIRLLKHCSSWTQLEKSNASHQFFELQTPVVSVRLGTSSSRHSILSLRKAVVDNGVATPFQQVLSWMSENEDYFAASSLALDLLRDSDTLRFLWKSFNKIDDANERAKLEGILDGIVPITGNDEEVLSTLTQLADMTVGCLTKGGFLMSSTLEYFLDKDQHYDTARASLILVATAVCTLSNDDETVLSAMGQGYSPTDKHNENILWPIRCLLRAAVARNSLFTALLLLNAAIPDELRHRSRTGIAATSIPSMELCLSIVTLILAASEDAAELLLNLIDELTRLPFWESLQHETKLELSLIEIRGKFPMLRQSEVRAWALDELQKQIESDDSALVGRGMADSLPGDWLKRLCLACLKNAGCDLTALIGMSCPESPRQQTETQRIHQYGLDINRARAALTAAPRSGGLDFDLLIPSLLHLQYRTADWNDTASTTTQSLLNAACYLAGRRTAEEPLFPIDTSTLMRQCTLTNNVSAGANLIGGPNGLILECCDILIRRFGLEMDQAEKFLLSNPMPTTDVDIIGHEQFSLQYGHIHILLLLEQHVLCVRTYGEFDTSHHRGKVDPVFAARTCLRTWWCLTQKHIADGTRWLVIWLRKKLDMVRDKHQSPRRLACAALVRSLIWPERPEISNDTTLASRLEIPTEFLVALTKSCSGLVETLPLYEVEKAWTVLERRDSSTQSVASSVARYNATNESIDDSFISAVSSVGDLE